MSWKNEVLKGLTPIQVLKTINDLKCYKSTLNKCQNMSKVSVGDATYPKKNFKQYGYGDSLHLIGGIRNIIKM